ncbi:MAG: hypothetical protein WCJ30_20695, partial [Deltaproteobacteria bacterium]
MTRAPWTAVMAFGLVALCGMPACHRSPDAAGSPAVRPEDPGGAPSVPFDVRAESTDVTFFWFDAHGAAHPVARVEDVPAASRRAVRVDPPRPEQRAPGWVYVADLRAPGADGRYPVRAVSSEQFASDLAGLNGLAQAMAAPSPVMPAAPAAPPSVLAPAAPAAPAAPGAHGAEHAQVTIYGA